MTDLIIVNLYGGIIPLDGTPIVRDGFLNFLERHSSKNIAIASYQQREKVESDLDTVGLLGKVNRVYTLEDAFHFPMENAHHHPIKTFAQAHFNTTESEVVYISNDPNEIDSMLWYNVRVIQIPHFENVEDQFSFDKVSVDSISTKVKYFFKLLQGKELKIEIQ